MNQVGTAGPPPSGVRGNRSLQTGRKPFVMSVGFSGKGWLFGLCGLWESNWMGGFVSERRARRQNSVLPSRASPVLAPTTPKVFLKIKNFF